MTTSEKTQSPADSNDSTDTNQDNQDRLNELRLDIAKTIKTTFPWLFRITVLVALALIALVWLGFTSGRTMDATVLAASIQVAFGMVIGFVCVYLGLMMTWFGIDAAYSFKASVGSGGAKAEGVLNSASPGLLFALAGIILIAVSLHKRIEYQENTFTPAGVVTAGDNGDSDSVQPGFPKNIDEMPVNPR